MSFVLCALIALVFGWMLQGRLVNDALTQQAQEAGAVVDTILWPHLTAQILRQPATGLEYARLDALVTGIKRNEHLVRIKIWNSRGVVVFSDDRRIVGRNFGIDPGLKAALAGHVSSGISDLSDPENVDERRFGPQLLQTYVPIRGRGARGKIIGAYEIYHDLKDLQPRIAGIRTFVIFSVGSGFLILYLSLFALVRGASRRLDLQARENNAKAARLATINDLTRSISAKHDLDSICASALTGLGHLTKRRPIVVIVHPSGQDLSIHATGLALPQPSEAACLLDRVKQAEAARGSQVNQAPAICSLDSSRDLCPCRQVAAFASVPIMLRDECIGFLGVGNGKHGSDHSLTGNELDALQELALQLAAAVDNAHLLRQATEVAALREVDRLKDEFISVLSHELRRPLSSIKGYAATLLLDDDWDQATRRDFLQVIDEESDRLSALVENLLDLSRLGSGMLTLHREPLLLAKLAAEVCDRIASQPDLAPHVYTLNFEGGFPAVEGDATRIAQVLLNLVENAAKYSEAGTTVAIGGSVLHGGRQVEISVCDEGIGMGVEELSRVFDRFYRVDNSLSRKTQGTGLGLAIAKGVVEAHGGTIWAESGVDGSTILFRLPISAVRDRLVDAPPVNGRAE